MELVNPANSVAFQKKSLYLRNELKPKQLSGNTLRYVLKFHKYEFLLILLTVLSSHSSVLSKYLKILSFFGRHLLPDFYFEFAIGPFNK